MKKQVFVILAVWVVLTLACNLSSNGPARPTQNDTQPAATGQSNQAQPAETKPAGKANATAVLPSPSPTIASQPVSINDALASLNSYKLSVTITTSSEPDPKSSNTISVVVQHSTDQDASYTHITITSSTDNETPSTTDSNIYAIGNDQCSGSKEDWTWDSISANQKEMQDLVNGMFSVTPVIENPKFVGEETVNNIPSNHFTFKISGLGIKSGSEVTANQGEYWLAKDGRYIVKYTLVTETRGGPKSEIIHLETNIELTEINQAVNITFPQQCLDAQKATPTP